MRRRERSPGSRNCSFENSSLTQPPRALENSKRGNCGQAGRAAHAHTATQGHIHTQAHTHAHTHTHMHTHSEETAGRQAGRQAGRAAQSHSHTGTHTHTQPHTDTQPHTATHADMNTATHHVSEF